MSFRRVHTGERLKIPARTFNAFIDAAEAHQRHGVGDVRQRNVSNTNDYVLVKNNSGGDLDRFSVVGIDGVIISPDDNLDQFKSRIALTGVTPTADHTGKFAVLLEPAPDGQLVRAAIDGLTVCKVEASAPGSGSGDRFADIEAGTTDHLVAKASGVARIIWRQSGTGATWAVVRLGDGSGGTLPAEITGEASGGDGVYSAKLLVFDGSGGLTDATPTITWTDCVLEINGREGIPVGSRIEVTPIGSDDSGTQWYCFADDSSDAGSVDTSVAYSHSEHADAANSNSWDRATQSSNRGVKVTMQTGTRYDDAGDQTLYAYLRDLTFDADGHLVAISVESKVTIDVTEDCA
ncbi:MAG: hypothetical protein GC154_15895 [bacterium]|nr:hypothetical protein [bacterium]